MRVRRFLWISIVVAALFPGPGLRADLRYRAEIVGAKESDLADLLDDVSELKSLEDRPPASEEALRRRAERDLGRLADAAHSLGYWDAQFKFDLDAAAEPAKVTVTVEPGPLYHVDAVTVLGPGGRPLAAPATSRPLPLQPGDPARTAPVVAAENALVTAFADNGHPFAKAEDRRVVIDHAARTMAVTYRIAPGPEMRFGAAKVEGLDRLDPLYVERRLRWRQDERYDASKVEETRRALIETGLFSTVQITPAPDPTDLQQAVMTVAATERLHRSVGAGVGYNTSQGLGARVFWENRNLFGYAENLRLSAEVGQQIDQFRGTFRRPDFLTVDQDFLATAEGVNDTPVAYNSRRALASVGLERRFNRYLSGGLALSLTKANVEQLADTGNLTSAERTQHYTLVGVPAYLKLDLSDNLLNPNRGYRAQLSLTPAHTFSSPTLNFVTSLVSGSGYWPLGAHDRAVIAGRLALGSIDGAPLAELPADQRLYVGGGGSLRPYGYQMAGPLAPNEVPIGGKSSLALNLEARIKITETIGIVPFIDAGSFYEAPFPQLGRTMLWGAGLGFRYYTGFGPLRLDLATPLHKRSADSPIQVYISLGQAF
jgi:translocation and assembly module TamA